MIFVVYEKDEFLNYLWLVCLCGYMWIRFWEVFFFCEVKGVILKELVKKKVSLCVVWNFFCEFYF